MLVVLVGRSVGRRQQAAGQSVGRVLLWLPSRKVRWVERMVMTNECSSHVGGDVVILMLVMTPAASTTTPVQHLYTLLLSACAITATATTTAADTILTRILLPYSLEQSS